MSNDNYCTNDDGVLIDGYDVVAELRSDGLMVSISRDGQVVDIPAGTTLSATAFSQKSPDFEVTRDTTDTGTTN